MARSHGSGTALSAGCDEVLSDAPNATSVTFDTVGLPLNTSWVLTLAHNGSYVAFCALQSNDATLRVNVTPGLYNFSVENVSAQSILYVPSPSTGVLNLLRENATVDLTFGTLGLSDLIFEETGLANGTVWEVTVQGGPSVTQDLWSMNTTLIFRVPDGTYRFFVHNDSFLWDHLLATPGSGSVVVSGTASVVITFTQVAAYPVTFTESGLPGGVFWGADVSDPWSNEGFSTGSPSWTYWLPNGTYNYTIQNTSNFTELFVPSVSAGTLHVDGTSIVVAATYRVASTYTLTFVETGLPIGTNWTVIVHSPAIPSYCCTGVQNGSTSSVPLLPNGTYNYSFWTATGVLPEPPTGQVVIDGASVTVMVTFKP